MAVLKQTSPTAWPVAPKPSPSSTVPSAKTNSAVGLGSSHSRSVCGCVSIAEGLHHPLTRSPPDLPRPARANLREAIAVLREDINNALKAAMKASDKRRVSTLRLINAEILKRETSAAERLTLGDAE